MTKTNFFEQLKDEQKELINKQLPKKQVNQSLVERTDKKGNIVYFYASKFVAEDQNNDNFSFKITDGEDTVKNELALVVLAKEAQKAEEEAAKAAKGAAVKEAAAKAAKEAAVKEAK